MVLLDIDPNVLVSGLIAQGPPAEVVNLVRCGEVRAASCPRLLAELEGVLRRPRFRRYVEPDEVDAYLDVLRSITTPQPDPIGLDDIECRDPNDAYLIALARRAEADAVVSGDRDLTELEDPQPLVLTPAGVLDRWDPVPRRPFPAVRGTFPGGSVRDEERRAAGAPGTASGRLRHPADLGHRRAPHLAWVQALCHGGDDPPEGFQRDRLDRAQGIGAEEGYQLRQHGVVIGGPSQFRVVRNRASGEEPFRLFADDTGRAAVRLARQFGLPAEDLMLEDERARGAFLIARSTQLTAGWSPRPATPGAGC